MNLPFFGGFCVFLTTALMLHLLLAPNMPQKAKSGNKKRELSFAADENANRNCKGSTCQFAERLHRAGEIRKLFHKMAPRRGNTQIPPVPNNIGKVPNSSIRSVFRISRHLQKSTDSYINLWRSAEICKSRNV